MADETKVRVALDTRAAKDDLVELVRTGQNVADETSNSLRRVLRKGAELVGVGAAIGTGLSAVKAASSSGFGDVIGEMFAPLGAQLAQSLLGDLAVDARATKRTRDEAIGNFAQVSGALGAIPPGVDQWFAQTKALRMQEEKGKQMFETDPTGAFHSKTEVKDLIGHIMKGIGEMIAKAATNLGDRLIGAIGGK